MDAFTQLREDVKVLIEVSSKMAQLEERYLHKLNSSDKRNYDPEMAERIRKSIQRKEVIYYRLKEKLGI
jgi:hypothetical protein